jgi:hypothetical protein
MSKCSITPNTAGRGVVSFSLATPEVIMCAGRRRWRLDEVVHGLEGDSFFIASKAANFDAVVPSVIGPAPLMD